MTERQIPHPTAIINRAGHNGLVLGLYLSLLAVITGLSASVSVLSPAVWLMSAGVLVMAYRYSLRAYAAAGWCSRFVDLWAEGIVTFLLGSLFLAVTVYVCLRFVAPDWLGQQLDYTITVFESQPDADLRAWGESLSALKHSHMPTATDVALEMIVLNIIAGFVVSMFTSAIVMARYASAARRKAYEDAHSAK